MEKRELRIFGLALAVVIAVPWIIFRPGLVWPWLAVTGVVVVAIAVWLPMLLSPLHWLLTRVGHAVSRITTPLLLGILYFVIMAPLGLALRLSGHDPMRRKWDQGAETYRQPSAPLEPGDFEKPF